jgi:hypothetical protein
VIRRPFRTFAVCLALLGQVAGAFGLPAARGSVTPKAHEAACGCCPVDRLAGHCCCSHQSQPPPAADLPPCCRKKDHAVAPAVEWVLPALRAKCQGPDDQVPESVIPVTVPPEPATGWTAPTVEAGRVPVGNVTFPSSSHVPDDPPPRAG